MKKFIVLLIFLMLTFSLLAKDKPEKQTELGISFLGFKNSPRLIFKTGNEYLKLRVGNISLGGGDNNRYHAPDRADTKSISKNFGGSLGLEYNNTIFEKLNFNFGFDLYAKNGTYSVERTDTTDLFIITTNEITITKTYQLYFILGLNYALTDKFIIGVEYKPYLSYQYSTYYYGREDLGLDLFDENENFNYDFDPEIYITFSYRF